MSAETTEKIVEAYVRYVKKWATIANIKCPGQFEIDLLAINPISGDRYHIESGVSISGGYSQLTTGSFCEADLKTRVLAAGQRRTLGYFKDRKFSHPQILEKLQEYGFMPGNYKKVIVSWGWTNEANAQADDAKITLWDFRDLMQEIADMADGKTYFTDDALRTIQLFVKSRNERPHFK